MRFHVLWSPDYRRQLPRRLKYLSAQGNAANPLLAQFVPTLAAGLQLCSIAYILTHIDWLHYQVASMPLPEEIREVLLTLSVL